MDLRSSWLVALKLESTLHGATLSKHADIMNWLMNEAECPTTWEPLLQIRRANPNYDDTRRPVY